MTATLERPEAQHDDPDRPPPDAPLVPTGNLRRRLIVNRLATGGATGAAILAVGVLAIVIWSVAHKGASELNFRFLTSNPPLFGGLIGIAQDAETLLVQFRP